MDESVSRYPSLVITGVRPPHDHFKHQAKHIAGPQWIPLDWWIRDKGGIFSHSQVTPEHRHTRPWHDKRQQSMQCHKCNSGEIIKGLPVIHSVPPAHASIHDANAG